MLQPPYLGASVIIAVCVVLQSSLNSSSSRRAGDFVCVTTAKGGPATEKAVDGTGSLQPQNLPGSRHVVVIVEVVSVVFVFVVGSEVVSSRQPNQPRVTQLYEDVVVVVTSPVDVVLVVESRQPHQPAHCQHGRCDSLWNGDIPGVLHISVLVLVLSLFVLVRKLLVDVVLL